MNAVATVPAKPLTTMKESIAAGGGIISIMASKYNVEPLVLRDTIHNTIFDGKGTEAEFIAFLVVANEYKLNPLTREIYAFPKKGGGIVPVVSIDGWISLVNSHPQFKGMEFEPRTNEKGDLYAYTCRIWRKDREMPTAVTEYLDECIRSTEPWKMKNRMLRHKALIQCARYAFGFSGIYDDDEGAVIAEARSAGNSTAPPPPVLDMSDPPAPPQIEDAVIVSETAPAGPSPAEAQAADAPPGPPPVEGASAADTEEPGINPDDEIANLIDKLAYAQDEATVEEWYAETDIEAALSDFTGYVEKARQVKAAQVERVRGIAARAAKAEPQAAAQAEAAAPPPPPALADEDEGEAPAPPPADAAGFNVNGWEALTTQDQYAHYAKLISEYATKLGDATIIEKFFADSAKMRAALLPIATAKAERKVIVDGLNAAIDAIRAKGTA